MICFIAAHSAPARSWRPSLPASSQLWLDSAMAYVVADPCVKCKYTDCVAVCPVDCFYEGKNSLAINPEAWPDHLKSQADTAATWNNITEQKKPLPGADEAAKEENKIGALTLESG